ncbi:MAG: HD domain-containing phosphohydrolase [Desulfuromonadales bacterium]|nr:HD domain-containing phosphohydrolase [Desulfuromonadales bacterium]
MNSLKVKFLGLTIIIMLVAISLTTWYNLRTQQAMLHKLANEHGRLLAETVHNSIISDMANGRNDRVVKILDKIHSEPSIDRVRIFDESGRILLSARSEEIGDLVTTSELMAYRTGNFNFIDKFNDSDAFNSIIPIHNGPSCYACHEENQEVLGILNLQLSFRDLNSMQVSGQKATVMASGVMLTILILTITAFLLVYVDSPIRKLASAMEHVEKGHFERARAHISSSDEMTHLSNKFNYMVQRLRELLESTVKHEREIAVTQEKLAHSEEVQAMNLILEERLKEIEYLNINLEERIEEIEEANYKIADLASELEEKNLGLVQAVERLQSLYQMGLAINSTVDQKELLEILSAKAMETLRAQVGYILLRNGQTGRLQVGGVAGISEDYDSSIEIPLAPGGVSYHVIENRQPALIANLDGHPHINKMSRLGFIRESVICAPLNDADEVVGTITIANPIDGSEFSTGDLELLSTIATQASVALRNARLYEEQQQTYLSTVQAMVSAIEASDAYTRGHSERVTSLSLSLARHLRLDDQQVKVLEQAAVLHDIGKIGIDINLLHKKEKLSTADFDILRLHPSIGVRILEPIQFLAPVRQIIHQHHERYDGKGYPDGLHAEQICLEARILAVCDTYDAMTSDRPYRQALPHQIAIQEIKDHSGTQFDPEVAAAFLDLHEKGLLPQA